MALVLFIYLENFSYSVMYMYAIDVIVFVHLTGSSRIHGIDWKPWTCRTIGKNNSSLSGTKEGVKISVKVYEVIPFWVQTDN